MVTNLGAGAWTIQCIFDQILVETGDSYLKLSRLYFCCVSSDPLENWAMLIPKKYLRGPSFLFQNVLLIYSLVHEHLVYYF